MFRQVVANYGSMGWRYLIVAAVLLLTTFPGPAAAFSENVQRSYQLEIFRNPALGLEDFRYMAAAILIANQGLSREQALLKAATLTARQAKALIRQDFPITYFEIPLKVLQTKGEVNFASLPDLKANRQVFERQGEKWVRWFVHPLHDARKLEEAFGEFRGKPHFRALLTSSRSLVIEDPSSGAQWSLKSSLNRAQGPFRNKDYSSLQAAYHFEMSRIIASDPYLRSRFFLEESFLSLKSPEIDEGQIVRSLDPFASGDQNLALATLFDPSTATRLAIANGFGTNWRQFLVNRVMPSLGKTLGHLYEKYGLIHNSLHSQNITVRFAADGTYRGVTVRDPDFDVNIDRFRQVFGKEAADSYIAKSNIRTYETILVDFSVLNGMRHLRLTPTEQTNLYRELGVSFVGAFLAKVAELRSSAISPAEINRRALEQTRVESQDEYGLRLAVSLAGPEIDRLLDPNEVFEPVTEGLVQKIPLQDLVAARSLILQELTEGGRGLSRYEPADLARAWSHLTDEMSRSPNGASELGHLLRANDPKVIRRLIVMLNTNQNLQAEVFFMELMERYPEISRSNDIAFFFNSHYNENLMSRFLASGRATNLAQLWGFRSTNGLLKYPDAILNRFFARLDDKTAAAVYADLQLNQTRPAALRDSHLLANEARIRRGLDLRASLIARAGAVSCQGIFTSKP